MQVTTTGSQAFDTTENTSTTTLTGLVDLVATQLTDDVQSPPQGSAQTLQGFIQNASNLAAGPFTVTLYLGDPLSPQLGLTVLATQNFTNGLAANTSTMLSFPVTIPSGAADDVYTMVVDSGGALVESNENNNEARYELDYRGDPAIAAAQTAPVTATLLNSGNSNNVQVTVNVSNLDLSGGTISNIPIDLQVSRNGGPLTTLGQMVIASLAPGASTQEVFTVTALAGDDLFVASVDSSAFAQDINPSNNIGTADLTVAGLPTLTATLGLSRPASVAGTSLTLNATVMNNGIADATSVPLVVLASLTSGGPSVVIGNATVPSVTGLASQLVQISLNTSGLAPGLYTITLEIDPGQTIIQGSDAGNVVTTSEILLVPNSDVATGTTGIDGITLVQDLDGVHVDWTLNGSSGGQLPINDPNGLTINGNGANDVITLVYTSGNPLPNTLHLNSGTGNFMINGLQGTNPLAATKLDLGRSTVFISYSASDPIAAIKTYLHNGYNNGAWNGAPTATTGVITSANAAASPTHVTGIGYADFADGQGIDTMPNTIELTYTLYGDANLDHQVNSADLQILLFNFNRPGAWDQADFN